MNEALFVISFEHYVINKFIYLFYSQFFNKVKKFTNYIKL